jgi:hypothetical protein
VRALVLAVALAAVLASGEARSAQLLEIRRVAVLPMGRYADGEKAVDVTAMVTELLQGLGFEVIAEERLNEFLVQKRIRKPEFLDRQAIQALGLATHADALLMGFTSLTIGEEHLQVTMNGQLVDCHEGTVAWANTVAVCGDDFETVLGLGRVTSTREILELAVEGLLEDLPRQVRVEGQKTSPYELVRASFTPDALRGGEEGQLSVEVHDAPGKVRELRAFILEEEIPLTSKDGRWFTGKVRAPALDGTYKLGLYLRDDWNRVFRIEAAASLNVRNTPLQVSIRLPEACFSPNGDGTLDSLFIIPATGEAEALRRWRVEILNADGKVVRSDESTGNLPEAFVWDGRSGKGERLPDGAYSCRLTVEDRAGNVSTTPGQELVLDRTPPELKLLLVSDPKEPFLEVIGKDTSGLISWRLNLYDEKGEPASRFAGQRDLAPVIPLGPNMRQEASGWAFYELEADDRAGNRLRSGRVPLERKVPRIKEEDLPKKEVWIEDF